MTKQEAKTLSVEVWQYLADHPECQDKENIATNLWLKIEHIKDFCPLCETIGYCWECPLGIIRRDGRGCANGSYNEWCQASDDDTRQQAAQKILDIIKAWEPEEETK